jgi:hypothetical protein
MTPGPPIPAAAPVDLVDTSEAIVYRCSAEPKPKTLCRYPAVPIEEFSEEIDSSDEASSLLFEASCLGEGDLLLERVGCCMEGG